MCVGAVRVERSNSKGPTVKSTLAKINHTIWELRREIQRQPGNATLKRDVVRFFHESRSYVEKRDGIPEEERSFLLLQQRESICCFLIHGAGGTPAEMRELGMYLFQQGFTVYAMRLPLEISHDASARRLAGTKARRSNRRRKKKVIEVNSWGVNLSEAEIVLDTLLTYNANTYVIGFSFGGTIALNLAEKYPLKGAILIAPALYVVKSGRYLTFQFARKVIPAAARSIAPREYTVLELMELTRSHLREIPIPICVIQATDDPVISSKGFSLLRSKSRNQKSRFHILPRGGHLLIDDEITRDVFKICGDFIKEM